MRRFLSEMRERCVGRSGRVWVGWVEWQSVGRSGRVWVGGVEWRSVGVAEYRSARQSVGRRG